MVPLLQLYVLGPFFFLHFIASPFPSFPPLYHLVPHCPSQDPRFQLDNCLATYPRPISEAAPIWFCYPIFTFYVFPIQNQTTISSYTIFSLGNGGNFLIWSTLDGLFPIPSLDLSLNGKPFHSQGNRKSMEFMPSYITMVHLERKEPKTPFENGYEDFSSVWDSFLYLVASWVKTNCDFSCIPFDTFTCNLGALLLPPETHL